MIKAGLVSITFRQLSVDRIIRTCREAGVQGIEWGGDVHVPHGSLDLASEVARKTAAAGLEVTSYGSYHRFLDDSPPFPEVLETALRLEAPVLRCWAGKKGSQETNSDEYRTIIQNMREAAASCSRSGVRLGLEYHRNTLTDTVESTMKLMDDVGHDALTSYWQPPVGQGAVDCIRDLRTLGNRLQWIHVFHWEPDISDRRSLAQGREIWESYLREIDHLPGDRWALLEHVKDDSPASFIEDAATLRQMINRLGS